MNSSNESFLSPIKFIGKKKKPYQIFFFGLYFDCQCGKNHDCQIQDPNYDNHGIHKNLEIEKLVTHSW